MKAVPFAAGLLCLLLSSPAFSQDQKAAVEKPKSVDGDPRAGALMEQANKSRYLWSPDTVGVSAKFTWKKDGKLGRGEFSVELFKRGSLSVTCDAAEFQKDARSHIASLIGHRTPPRADAPARPAAPMSIVVEDDLRGPLLMPAGDPMLSTFRVKDGKLVQVNRTMGDRRFSIDVSEFEKAPDGKFYPTVFSVTWWNAADGKRVEHQTFTISGFHNQGGLLFPKAEKIVTEKDGAKSTVEIEYSEVKFGK